MQEFGLNGFKSSEEEEINIDELVAELKERKKQSELVEFYS